MEIRIGAWMNLAKMQWVQAQLGKPAKQQGVIQPLHMVLLAVDRVQHLKQKRTQQLFRSNGWAAILAYKPSKIGDKS
jgi:hypothetical protein